MFPLWGGGRAHALSVLDLIAQTALTGIDTGALTATHGLAFAGGKVWFTAEGAKAIARFDPATSTIDWIMGTGQDRTHMLYVAADEKTIYTANEDSGDRHLAGTGRAATGRGTANAHPARCRGVRATRRRTQAHRLA